jgi:hypothetical protein
MSHRNLATRTVATLAAVTLIACSGQSPTAPDAAHDGDRSVSLLAKAVPGSYELSFWKSGSSGLEPVSSLLVGSEELILGAHVENRAGLPARSGAVNFQYCSLKGLPPNDITRADEAPSAACSTRLATWANLTTVAVDTSGNAYMDFGIVRIPRTVGFRCRYISQGSSIGSGMCPPRDFTWVSGD